MNSNFHFGTVRTSTGENANTERAGSANQTPPREKPRADRIFLITVVLLTALGSIMIASAGSAYAEAQYGDAFHFISKQIMFAMIGFVAMFVASKIKPSAYCRYAPHLYGFTIILLVLVLIIGVNLNGAKRWLNLGFATFQPSELAKLSIVMILSRYFTLNKDKIYTKKGIDAFLRDTVYPFCYIGIFCGLIALEKHLSAIVIIGSIGVLMMFVAGSRLKHLFGVAGVGVTGVAAFALLTDYTKKRIDIWLNPERYPQEGGWQTIQGKMAIGSGGFFGLGLGNSRLKYSYVAEPANDFIFTVSCEELGFIGATVIVLLFALLVYRGFCIASHQKDMFGKLIAYGISAKVALQVIFNIAVVTNVFPNTGIALPFFSYGGTSLIILLFEMGIILSVSRTSDMRK